MLVPLNNSQQSSTYRAKTVALLKQFYGTFDHKNMQGLFNSLHLEMEVLYKLFVVV